MPPTRTMTRPRATGGKSKNGAVGVGKTRSPTKGVGRAPGKAYLAFANDVIAYFRKTSWGQFKDMIGNLPPETIGNIRSELAMALRDGNARRKARAKEA